MFDYFHKFNKLKPELKKLVSSSEAVKVIEELEREFKVDLAPLIMRVMIKEIDIKKLPLVIFTEFALGQKKSEELSEKLKKKVFYQASDYLGFSVSQADKVKKNDKNRKKKKSFDPLVLEIYENLKVRFNQNKKRKLFSLLDKYIRGLKSRFITREILTEDIDSGGFSLSDKLVDDIFIMIQKAQDKERKKVKENISVKTDVLDKIKKLSHGKKTVKSQAKILESEDKTYELAPLHPAVIDKQQDEEDIEKKKKEEAREEEKKKKEAENKKLEEEKKRKEIEEEKKKKEDLEKRKSLEKEKKQKTEAKLSAQKDRPVSSDSSKVKMTDVKKVKITGPIDELRYMDLTNLRRLSDDPVEAFEKITQKLKVLENIDYSKMLEGVQAWRQSPVYKMYLNIFFKASNEGIRLKDLVKKLESSEKDYLNQAEIKALIDFNKKLIF